jgi:outer membrane protein assembly factor BamB
VALDKATGKQVWKQDHNIKYASNNGDFHKAYGTPSVLMVKGQPQLVSPSAEATIAREPRTGKELWRISTGGMNQSMRPILANNLIYLSCGHEQKVLAVKAGTTEIVWKSVKEAPSRPSILVLGNQVYMVNDKGVATCLNALTGKPVWRERFDGEFSASPVCANGMMVFSNEQGKSFVLEASGEYKPVATNKLDAGCMASPAIVDDCLILRTKTHLYCLGKK